MKNKSKFIFANQSVILFTYE